VRVEGVLTDNGSAERFFRTMLGWAYGAIYGSSAERTSPFGGWLWRDDHTAPSPARRRRLGSPS
jgi:hypothetical protein